MANNKQTQDYIPLPVKLTKVPSQVLLAPTAAQIYGHGSPLLVTGIEPKVQVLRSIEKPMVLEFLCRGEDSRVQKVKFIFKIHRLKDRLECRASEFFVWMVEVLGEQGLMSRYSVIPIGPHCTLHEWIEDTHTLNAFVTQELRRSGPLSLRDKDSLARRGPVLQRLLLQGTTPEGWWPRYHNYLRSCAVWTVLGYLMGLGDRHGDNILVNPRSWVLQHIDYGVVFDEGLNLPTPEVVPARLTKNILAPMGVLQADGYFKYYLATLWERVLSHRQSILDRLRSILASDPATLESKHRNAHSRLEHDSAHTAEHLIRSSTDPASLAVMYDGWMPYL
jgi:serine/threonine-protein kinase ATR